MSRKRVIISSVAVSVPYGIEESGVPGLGLNSVNFQYSMILKEAEVLGEIWNQTVGLL